MKTIHKGTAFSTSSAGFSLIELLTVVLMIAVLSAVALPQYVRTVERSRIQEAVGVIEALRKAEIRYYHQRGDLTNDLSELDFELPSLRYFSPPTFINVAPRPFAYLWIQMTRLNSPDPIGPYEVNYMLLPPQAGEGGFQGQYVGGLIDDIMCGNIPSYLYVWSEDGPADACGA
ncbi:MAG: prepilin-type N-terminal cleavage/methylation domain-containing protein [Elusimicrobia bacterium]|nr:prepilin-type N-terminal cleavage/methylation domain-containing protein [Elusimicrobiota bacterium]